MTVSIEGMDKFIGKTLKPEYAQYIQLGVDKRRHYLTRPDFYNGNTHINMYIFVDEANKIIGFEGNKCYSHYSGLYNRSANVREGKFTARDIAFLRKEAKKITE